MSMYSGIKNYKVGTATVKASFPIDLKGNLYLCCEMCRFYRKVHWGVLPPRIRRR